MYWSNVVLVVFAAGFSIGLVAMLAALARTSRPQQRVPVSPRTYVDPPDEEQLGA